MRIFKTKWEIIKSGPNNIKQPSVPVDNGSIFYDGDNCYILTSETMALEEISKEDFIKLFPETGIFFENQSQDRSNLI